MKKISLHEAREIAKQIAIKAEKEIHEERIAEARFLNSLWEEDTDHE